MSYSIGSKMMIVHDDVDDISFQTWLLYPSVDVAEKINVGPYEIDACPEGNFAAGRFPLVVISHGGGGSHLLYRSIATHLAQHGFWVAMPAHHRNNRLDNSLGDDDYNLTLRTRHVRLVIDTLFEDWDTMHYLDAHRVHMIGHSIGGCTALSIAGAKPWSVSRVPIEVTADERISSLVLLAPAAAWFQHPDSFLDVHLPIYVFSAEHDRITPLWQTELIKQKVMEPSLVTLETVRNAGHLSFLSPFPAHMKSDDFPPSQDPAGFDRVAFHEELKEKIRHFFEATSGFTAM